MSLSITVFLNCSQSDSWARSNDCKDIDQRLSSSKYGLKLITQVIDAAQLSAAQVTRSKCELPTTWWKDTKRESALTSVEPHEFYMSIIVHRPSGQVAQPTMKYELKPYLARTNQVNTKRLMRYALEKASCKHVLGRKVMFCFTFSCSARLLCVQCIHSFCRAPIMNYHDFIITTVKLSGSLKHSYDFKIQCRKQNSRVYGFFTKIHCT